jgi:hypothetical protein
MTRRRSAARVSNEVIARLVIHRNGRKALKDADLALLFGVTPQRLYQTMGSTLWLFSRSFMFQLTCGERCSRADSFQPSLAFTKAGVMAIAALLRDEQALDTGMRIVRVLKQRKRSSAGRKYVRRRPGIDPRSLAYERAAERLWAELQKILRS